MIKVISFMTICWLFEQKENVGAIFTPLRIAQFSSEDKILIILLIGDREFHAKQ